MIRLSDTNVNVSCVTGPRHDGDYLGRQCCSLSPVHRCQTACLRAKHYSEDLASECRKSDNMQLFQCLNLIRVRKKQKQRNHCLNSFGNWLSLNCYFIMLRKEKNVAVYRPIPNAERHAPLFTAPRRHPLPELVSLFLPLLSNERTWTQTKTDFPRFK